MTLPTALALADQNPSKCAAAAAWVTCTGSAPYRPRRVLRMRLVRRALTASSNAAQVDDQAGAPNQKLVTVG